MSQHMSALPPDFTIKTRFGGLNRYKTMLGLASASINSLILICLLSLAARFAVGTAAAAQSAAVESKSPPLMDRETEMALALSACPAVQDDKGVVAHFPPHVMFYAPYLINADIGSDGKPGGPAFSASEGTPYALIIVPVGVHTGPAHASAADSPE